ncbi:hypothetical protein A2997_00750 [Candidatus Nomurabacteria bacterium RIFCSPLOWO2_01_FULL_36_10b]|uniref:Peptidase S11 D-alanyl-D-alanine carboxypeptidase A N-terminal domain-containing protein n=1 Tax=Candidatus Nomurabacteria bacterium RIFCSPLOWO2_01_FULL_36_10b TaxID=1801766 RepID=A0A1F6WNN0_9BACT|nr:MAG: hypothetical protein A2997_00750 [Candidatus Nomurabacteria bacterium RIFCSPLOWO2_01_FULL_36_10b]
MKSIIGIIKKLQKPLDNEHTYYLVIIGVMTCILGVFLFASQQTQSKIDRIRNDESMYRREILDSVIKAKIEEAAPNLFAESILIYDLENENIVYEKEAKKVRGLASLTKLMTARIAGELFSPEAVFTINDNDMETGNTKGLQVGDTWPIKYWLPIMLVTSSNEVSAMFERYDGTFLEHMNKYAKSLGMNDTIFNNSTGLDINGGLSSKGTAYDMMLLVRDIINHSNDGVPFNGYAGSSVVTFSRFNDSKPFVANHTHEGLSKLHRVLLSKTGYTQKAGGAMAFVTRPISGYTFIVIILQSTFSGRFDDVARINDIIIKYTELFASYDL